MIGTVNNKSKKKSAKNSSPIITLPDSPTGEASAEVPADIHVVESSTAKSKSGGKKKGRRKINKTQKRNLTKMNLLMRNVNLAILVSSVMRSTLQEIVHIELKFRKSSKVLKRLLS